MIPAVMHVQVYKFKNVCRDHLIIWPFVLICCKFMHGKPVRFVPTTMILTVILLWVINHQSKEVFYITGN